MVSRAEDDWSPPADLWPEDGEDIEIALTLQQALVNWLSAAVDVRTDFPCAAAAA